MLRKLDDQSIIVEAKDTRIIELKRGPDVKFLKDGADMKQELLKPGDHLLVEASQDEHGYLHAVNVTFEKEGTAEERAHASQAVETLKLANEDEDERPKLRRKDSPAEPDKAEESDKKAEGGAAQTQADAPKPLPPIAQDEPDLEHIPTSTSSHVPVDESDAGPPRLKRGKPAPRKSSSPPEQVAVNHAPEPVRAGNTTASVSAPPSELPKVEPVVEAASVTAAPPDPRIEKAREEASAFTETLPDYVCKEMMARFVNTSHPVNWQPIDIVSAELVYEKGHEHYRNLTINGKPVKKKIEELPGAWSTGEFGTVLVDIFSPSTAADFRYRRQGKSGGRDAFMYDFEVEQPHSHWHVWMPSQSMFPAYHGAIWIDKETGRVLRIEMQAYHMPEEFPLDKVESATDYQYIRIGEKQFLLPVHAETLTCERGTSVCSHNVIDFRNYHKYTGEATIEFGKTP